MNSNNEYLKYISDEVGIIETCERLGMHIDKKGNQYVCLCPFHEDRHPSLNLYIKTNQYHCFSCGAHGNIFSLVKELKRYEFHEAVTWIENEFPQVLTYKPKLIKFSDNKSLNISNPNELAYECYKVMNDDEKLVLSNFAKDRGYDKSFLENVEVFYGAENKLIQKFPAENIDARDKLESKMLIKRIAVFDENLDHGYRDYFKERIIITLRDSHNNIVGFSGRTRVDELPKYLFTKNLPKSSFLYRLNNVRNSIFKYENKSDYIELYLVEGIFDALRLESLGINATAVLGSHMTENQTTVLEKFIDEMQTKKIPVFIHIFMDSDNAGIKGAFITIKNILKSNISLKCICDVVIIKRNNYDKAENLNHDYKDADEFLKEIKESTLALEKLKENTINIFDFLFRYFAPDIDLREEISSEKIYNGMKSDEKKIVLLNNIKNMIPEKIWNDVLNRYNVIYENKEKDAFNKIKNYILNDEEEGYSLNIHNNGFLSSMQNAVELARNSYKKEILSLDDYTWDRILMGADAFYEYFINCLKNNVHLQIPLLSMNLPKNRVDNRKKSIYIHEQLIMQQYVLNELLGRDSKKEYEYVIPAVRFNPDENETKITTGRGYYEFYRNSCDKVVSFAYQISTKAVNGDATSRNGMFRPFYECWKDYINFIQEGIKKLESETLYRVKLDIKGFYDNISNVAIRSSLSDPVNEAIIYANNRFKEIKWSGDGNTIVEWIIGELFDYKYYNPMDGTITERDNALIGIPQGPNLSAYVANIILFNLDKNVMKYVNRINNDYKQKNVENDKDKIVVRYARYVDDMIIISSDAKCISSIKEIVGSELYKLGLSLSTKTDEADAISKEDALEWTVSEKGGLGASSVFDFIDDDDIDTIIDNNYDWNKIDRRNALKLLSNMMINAKCDDSIVKSNNEFEEIAKVFFKTEEIRFNDIVRFSKSMICNLLEDNNMKNESNLLKSYENKWNELIKLSPEDSLFKRENIHTLAFLEASIQLLNIEVTVSDTLFEKNYIHKVQKKLIENIKEYKIVENLVKVFNVDSKNILSINKDFLKIKILSLIYIINKFKKYSDGDDYLDYTINFDQKNEYCVRWEYCNKKFINDKCKQEYKLYKYHSSEEQIVNYFHFIITNIITIENSIGYNTIISKVWGSAKNLILGTKNKNILAHCIATWCSSIENNEEINKTEYDKNADKIAVKVLINFVPNKLLAEIISENEILKNCIFDKEIKEYLPVFPGINYPGLLGVKNQNSKLLVERIEFKNTDKKFTIKPDIGWIESNRRKNDCSEIDRFKYKHSSDAVSLSDYIKGKENNTFDECIKAIADIYDKLYKKIQEIQINNEFVCVLSKENIYVLENNGELIFFCYCLKKEDCSYAVAVREGEHSYKLQSINESGNEYWQAGFILQDAFELNDKILSFSEENNSNNKEALTLLNYSFKRLTGKTININYKKRSTQSYENSVRRTIDTMKEFVDSTEYRDRYILNSVILDSFINYRMKQSSYDYGNGDIEYHLSLWSSQCININQFNLKKIIENNNVIKLNDVNIRLSSMRRVVAISYLLSIKIDSLCENSKKFEGLELLSKGLMCSAIFLNLKMQVFEQVEMLDDNQKKAFIDRELPYDLFGFDDRIILITKENSKKTLKEIIDNILLGKHDENIHFITPLGWILLLGYILEIDDSSSYIRGNNINRLKVRKILLDLKKIFLYDKENKQERVTEKSKEFPFEQLNEFNEKWNKNEFIELYEILASIDEETNTQIELISSKFFNTSYNRNFVSIQLDNTRLEKMKCFVTYGTIPHHNFSAECDNDKEGYKKFTQSVNSGQVIGISYVEDYLSKLTMFDYASKSDTLIENKAEHEHQITSENDEAKNENSDNTGENLKIDGTNSEISQGKINDNIQIEKEEKLSKDDDYIEKNIEESSENHYEKYGEFAKENMDDKLGDLFKVCKDNWKSRNKLFQQQSNSNEKIYFTTMDRIALFQFNIDDSSYKHPENEKCPYYGEQEQYSAVEFRRRKLLSPVLDACEKFGVDILVLPEYSVRPETVKWLANRIRQYSFSIWAGTFKITPGYDFKKLNLNNESKQNFEDSKYRCSAVLPIILNKVQRDKAFGNFDDFQEVQILMERFKKYPSIALDEVINTVPALQGTFEPIMKKNFKGKLFGDARDDVTELICAEMFLMASPSNYISFTKKSYDMYSRFGSDTNYDFRSYRNGVINDITDFGEYISIYQTKNKYNRTPIVLVPACTTRTADYYVNGQANYLAAGITTVLCNSAGNTAKGGSCFIGQNSWDDNKLRNKYEYKFNEDDKYKMRNSEDFIPKNTVYHGLQPGIYQQSCTDENRGALGVKEQALLICDVNPNITFKGSPNPESIMDSLSIVAHIPIIEEDIFTDKCEKCLRKCFNKCKKGKELWDRRSFINLKDLKKYVKKYEYDVKNNKGFLTTIDDNNPEQIEKILSNLSEEANSEWLKKRGEIYLKQHKNNPMKWPAPAFLDWLYVVVDYYEFFNDVENIKVKKNQNKFNDNLMDIDYEIQMPPFNNK